jgi:methionyl-tRNA formyltransferase
MTVTLHQVDDSLDTGPIFLEQAIRTPPDLNIHTLRYYTTLLVIEMLLKLVQQFCDLPPMPKKQDTSLSQYYGPMPWLLKLKTDNFLRRYAADSNAR